MPKRSNQFQELILEIEKSLADEKTTVNESELIKDSLGIDREIDVLVKSTLNEVEISIAVECRDYARDQTIVWIDELIGKFSNVNIDKVVAVSSHGFSDAATRKAEAHGIKTYSLDEAMGVNWPKALEDMAVVMYKLELCPLDTKIILDVQPNIDISLDENTTVYDEEGQACGTIGKEIIDTYESQARSSAVAILEKTNPEFYHYCTDKSTLVRMKVSGPTKRCIKGKSGLFYGISCVNFLIRAEISFYPTDNKRKIYKGKHIIELTGNIENAKKKAYGIAEEKGKEISIRIIEEPRVWTTLYKEM
jgi:hypothetical protein